MYATLPAAGPVAAGRVRTPGPRSNAPMDPLQAAMPPALARPVLAGPVLAGAVLAGAVLAGAAPESGLRGRRGECEALDLLVAEVRAGQSRVLVLRGEAGAGKTALLEYLLERASGCCTARTAGVESEMELTFAGLHQLCAPFLDRIERLPGPQREALSTAFNLREGAAPDRFAVGLAVLSLLSEVAAERPLVCVVDDAHWLDRASAQALAFVARHLAAKPAAVVFAAREPGDEQALIGLTELAVRGLAEDDARALLTAAVAGPLDERVRDRIVAETRGNPLALLEVTRRLAPEELAGGFSSPGDPAPPSRIEESFRRRLMPLPPATRMLLLVAAAEPLWDPVLVWRVAGQLGVEVEAAAAAAMAGLIESGGQVRFRHPLARSAVYRAASPEERQRAHRALAEAIDPDADPDRRAWHRACAIPGLDEGVAAELDRLVGRARARGGLAAAAAFCERAAELTPEPAGRARRALAAAQAKYQAGASDAALRLLAMAQAGPLDELGRARAELLRAQLTAGSGRGRDTSALLLEAAKRLEPLHLGLARDAYRDAFGAALTDGRLAVGGAIGEVAAAARALPPVPQPHAPDLLLEGLAVLATDGHAAGVPVLLRALTAFRDEKLRTEERLRWLPLACRVAHDVWDDESCYVLSAQLTGLAREAGALAVLPVALRLGARIKLLAGELAAAASCAAQAEAVTRATGHPIEPYSRLMLAAWRGHDDETRQLLAAAARQLTTRGEGHGLTAAGWAMAVLGNGRCRYEEALAAAEQGSDYPDEPGLAAWSAVELIEAAVRAGQPERGIAALCRLSQATGAAGTDWALGIEARSRALLSDGEFAERLYVEAIERLGRTRVRVELARAHLLYGEWLRRESRRVDAREHLRSAHEMLTAMGIAGFAERARRELLATGETVRKNAGGTAAELTAQEAQIVRLACDGHTNPEIGVRLFISARTVEWHLRKVFAKLGVASRKELRRILPDLERAGVLA
jgi:DNA-binding CsgD family transcriptional regulator/tetratricopeptide (TPR) repeat protein